MQITLWGFATYIGNFAPSISYEIYETVISGKIDRAKRGS